MKKRIFAFLTAFALVFTLAGCSGSESQTSDIEVIVEETIIQGGDNVSSDNNVSSIPQQGSSSSTPTTSTPSAPITVTPQNTLPDIDFEWKSHPQDFKLIALTFDDGPSTQMGEYVTLLNAYEGAGTFFVNGNKVDSAYKYDLMQNAVNYGWDIGNHGDNHLVATIGGAGGSEATYDQIKTDITTLTNKLETHLKNRDGSAYKVKIYRAPNIKPTANTFKICRELNYPVIWLAHDALDWDTTKSDKNREDVFKNGVGTWEDGDVILCHEVQQFADQTYSNLEKYLPQFYKAGYRFCSVTELMKLRGITPEQISGELNNIDNNRGMVTNIVKAAQAGKK